MAGGPRRVVKIGRERGSGQMEGGAGEAGEGCGGGGREPVSAPGWWWVLVVVEVGGGRERGGGG